MNDHHHRLLLLLRSPEAKLTLGLVNIVGGSFRFVSCVYCTVLRKYTKAFVIVIK